MSEQRVVITRLGGGQPRPYADSEYRYRIDIEFDPPTTGEPKTVRWTGDNLLFKAARIAWASGDHGLMMRFDERVLPGYKFVGKDVWGPEWHEARITDLKEVGPGIAEVLVVAPFLD